jgi:hypothetical protein
MLTGKQYALNRATLGVHINAEGKRTALQLPQGAVIKVLSGPKRTDVEPLVNVVWEGTEASIFLVDLQARGEEITSHVAHG